MMTSNILNLFLILLTFILERPENRIEYLYLLLQGNTF